MSKAIVQDAMAISTLAFYARVGLTRRDEFPYPIGSQTFRFLRLEARL
ncbi:MAG: hypothetical protein AAFZ52_15505 [Bacteroidota bacterium]